MSSSNNSANSFAKLLPLFKDQYAKKLKSLSDKPQNNKEYFQFLKQKLLKKN